MASGCCRVAKQMATTELPAGTDNWFVRVAPKTLTIDCGAARPSTLTDSSVTSGGKRQSKEAPLSLVK
jgi:hypothetical protein